MKFDQIKYKLVEKGSNVRVYFSIQRIAYIKIGELYSLELSDIMDCI